METTELKVGDDVFIEDAWEDDAGNFHSETLTISKINADGTLQFRIGHWKTRTKREQELQAWINKMEWYADNCEKV